MWPRFPEHVIKTGFGFPNDFTVQFTGKVVTIMCNNHFNVIYQFGCTDTNRNSDPLQTVILPDATNLIVYKYILPVRE